MISHLRWAALLLILLLVLLPTTAWGQEAAKEEADWVVRLEVCEPGEICERAEIDVLVDGFDVWHIDHKGHLLVKADAQDLSRLRALGYSWEVDAERTEQLGRIGIPLLGQDSGIPGFPCYRTVDETFARAAALAANHPDLATWIDIGDSWEKLQKLGGDDLFVLRLGHPSVSVQSSPSSALQPPLTLPVLFVNSALHAREYTTAELSLRFAERLLAGYGNDPDITWLLDHQQIHLLLQANPDGRRQAETGLSWRKNANNNYCPNTNDRGADLNRNFPFEWACCGGGSTSECSTTFRGAAAASEPETQAIRDYVAEIFPDQRPGDLTTPAPDDALGIFLDLHSFGEDVLWSWGFTTTQPPTPNGAQLYTLGRKYGFYTGYRPQHGSFSTIDGATKDYAYGEFGVPGFTIELGTSFFQSCDFFETSILEQNLDALLYMAKASRAPYSLPAGPEPVQVTVTPNLGELVLLSATVDDSRYTSLNGVEPAQTILSAQVYLDIPPWDGGTPLAMTASDGLFDEVAEEVELLLDTSMLEVGRHLLFVEATDTDGNSGVVSAVFLDVGVIFEDGFESGDFSLWSASFP